MFVATGLPLPFALVVFAWADKQHGMRCNPNLGLAALILAVYAVVVPTAAMVGAVAWAFVFRNRKRVLFVIPLVLLAYFAAAVCMFIMMGCALGG